MWKLWRAWLCLHNWSVLNYTNKNVFEMFQVEAPKKGRGKKVEKKEEEEPVADKPAEVNN